MIINRSGLAIRLHVETLRVMGRATQGVKLIDLKSEDMIAAVTRVPKEEEEEEPLNDQEAEDVSVENDNTVDTAENK